MEQQLQEISEKQKASWNQFSPGWKKWDADILDFMKPIADEMIDLLKPKRAETILEIAGGTGEPGLASLLCSTAEKLLSPIWQKACLM
jgi:ubiquinone/menaquinone biosynthesis C-methylase UbiE